MNLESTLAALAHIAHIEEGDTPERYQLDNMPPFPDVHARAIRRAWNLGIPGVQSLMPFLVGLDAVNEAQRTNTRVSPSLVFQLGFMRQTWDKCVHEPNFRRCIDWELHNVQMKEASRLMQSRLGEPATLLLETVCWDTARVHGLDASATNGFPQIWRRACPRVGAKPTIALWYLLCERDRALNAQSSAEKRTNLKPGLKRIAVWKQLFKDGHHDQLPPIL